MPDFAISRVLVPVDFSPQADAAVTCAGAIAQRFGAHVDLLHVLDEQVVWEGGGEAPATSRFAEDLSTSARHRLEAMATELGSRGLRVRVHVRPGRPVATTLELAAETGAGLIVMGTHGRRGVAHLLMGSVAEQVVRSAPCPVLTVNRLGAAETAADSQLAPEPAL